MKNTKDQWSQHLWNRSSAFTLSILLALLLLGCQPNDLDTSPASDESALFTLMDPEETGLYFLNEIKESEQLNILSYEYFFNGGGVAIGDVNHDSLPDVFFSGNFFGGRLFVNQGDLKFKQISETAGVFAGGFTTGVTMVDINGDGYDDIYLCRSVAIQPELRRNILFINNQDGTFTDRAAEYGLDDPSFSHYASFLDYDNDGDLDVYLLNHRIDFRDALSLKTYTDKSGHEQVYQDTTYQYVSDRLYQNNGNGKFTDVTRKAGLLNRAFGLSVTLADINQDNWMDIYVANDYADKDHFYVNNGDGTFSDQIDEMFLHLSKNSMGSDIADINNDGLPDLISLDMMPEDNQRQKQLKGPESYDLYHMAVDYGLSHQVMRNTLQLNNGNGTFSEIGQLAGVSHTDWSWTPLFADFDLDGFKDLFITNGLFRDLTDMDYIKYESNQALQKAGGKNRVKRMDLVKLMKSNPVSNYIYRNKGDLSFSNKTREWGMDTVSFSNGAVYADLDLDGDLDLIVNNYNHESFLYRNNASEMNKGHYLSIKLKGTTSNPDGIGTKVTISTSSGQQFRESSPYRGYLGSVDDLLHFGLGKDTLASVKVSWPDGKIQKLDQVKASQILTLHAENSYSAGEEKLAKPVLLKPVSNLITRTWVHREDDFIDFKREPLLEHQISDKGPFVTKGDINGDGQEDLYLGGAAGQGGTLYEQLPNGKFIRRLVPDFLRDSLYEDGQAVFLDVDNDNDLDLYVVSGGYAFPESSPQYQDRLYLNDGKGNFSKSPTALPPIHHNGTAVVALDFDLDGDQDLFVGGGALPNQYPYPDQSLLLINEKGTFSLQSNRLPYQGYLGMINDAIWNDIDQDDSVELLLVGEWMPLTVLSFSDGKFYEKKIPGFDDTSGWWNVIVAEDMDQDGDPDLIAGNRGNNSFYKAFPKHPASIYAKDFDQNGSIDAIPFYYFSDGKSHPKHTRDEIFAQYPGIRRKFQRYSDYADATLADIFSVEELAESLQLTATTFGTSYFENQGNGSFDKRVLPNQVQLSEIHGILPLDVNQDGHLDIILTGNHYQSDVEAGQSDAHLGSVLLGDGTENFSPLSISESGFCVTGDTREVIQIGKQILIMVNDGAPHAYQIGSK